MNRRKFIKKTAGAALVASVASVPANQMADGGFSLPCDMIESINGIVYKAHEARASIGVNKYCRSFAITSELANDLNGLDEITDIVSNS